MPVDASSCSSIPFPTHSPPLSRGVSIVLRNVMAEARGVWKRRRKWKEEEGRAHVQSKKSADGSPYAIKYSNRHCTECARIICQLAGLSRFLSFILAPFIYASYARTQTDYRCYTCTFTHMHISKYAHTRSTKRTQTRTHAWHLYRTSLCMRPPRSSEGERGWARSPLLESVSLSSLDMTMEGTIFICGTTDGLSLPCGPETM
jgi:hypothetical protein